MPEILREKGYILFIYSNEHLPIHVHVRKAGGEAVFELIPRIELRKSAHMKVSDLRRAEFLVRKHQNQLRNYWNENNDRQG